MVEWKDIAYIVRSYNERFPNYPPLVQHGRWIYGIWILGNRYRKKRNYYGAFPGNLLNRIHAMFPNATRVLHLFSGVVEKGLWKYEVTFDINPDVKPDVVGDAHELSKYFRDNYFDLIIADPPYSNEDAEHYGFPMVKRNVVIKECYKVLKPNGYLVWLDQVMPMYKKAWFQLIGTIGVIISTNHRFRVLLIFRSRG